MNKKADLATKRFNKELPRAHVHPSQVSGLIDRLGNVWERVKADDERNATWEWARLNFIRGELESIVKDLSRVMDEDLGGWPYDSKEARRTANERTDDR